MNLVPNMPIESYVDSQNSYVQPLSMDMLDDLSWPCQFMSPDPSPHYMTMPNYPISPISPGSMTVPHHAQSIALQRQRQRPALSPRTSISGTQTGGSPISPRQGFATVLQHPRKQDRERRKAQNRASQRAYRERKEVQLRDLAASLKETEAAMAETKYENKQLEARLDKMRSDLEALRKENEALRMMDGMQEGSQMQETVKTTQDMGLRKIQGVPTPPRSDETYDGDSRSNTASVIGTPKDVNFAMKGFNWDSVSLDSKETPMVGQDVGDGGGEVYW